VFKTEQIGAPDFRTLRLMHSDLELLRLERAQHQASERLGWITRLNSDPAVLRAAEELCSEATAALDAYQATHETLLKT
jgi:hypothetical protein